MALWSRTLVRLLAVEFGVVAMAPRTARPHLSAPRWLWRTVPVMPVAWIQEDWQRCCQQLKDAPLALQVAAVWIGAQRVGDTRIGDLRGHLDTVVTHIPDVVLDALDGVDGICRRARGAP